MPGRSPKPISEASLRQSALAYLERFAASAEMVRRVLMRRVERAARAGIADRDAGARWVAQVVDQLVAARLIDDDGFAAMKVGSLRRRGGSRRAIAARLGAQGLTREAIAAAMDTDAPPGSDPELAAAVLLARRRRLGPFRPGDRGTHRRRDLGVMARAGFSGEIAHRVIDAPDPDSLADTTID